MLIYIKQKQQGVADHPLLLSGIVLAGANQLLESEKDHDLDDGYLTAEEIALLDFQRVRCAVLSCCSTGMGTIEEATGVAGLKSAFEYAGVQNTVVNLWEVVDQYHMQMMSDFYFYHWDTQTPITEAINQVQRDFIRGHPKLSHPSLWGYWICYGSPGFEEEE